MPETAPRAGQEPPPDTAPRAGQESPQSGPADGMRQEPPPPETTDGVDQEPRQAATTEGVDADEATLSTGAATVDRALDRLSELEERDLHEHAAVYDEIHQELRSALDAAGE